MEIGRPPRILLGVTASVAAIKSKEIALALRAKGAEVKVVLTNAALENFNAFQEAEGLEVLTDKDEFCVWQGKGDPVLHIELRKWADVLLIAPLSANSLAKIAAGICDNLLTCIIRAWELPRPIFAAPAMNTFMWNSPFTGNHLQACKDIYNFTVIDVISKTLVCGDTGLGAMAEVTTIVETVWGAFQGSEAG